MDIKSLAAKLRALAERGEPGERELAQQKLDELLKKYDLSEDDIAADVLDYYDIRFYHPWEQKLLWQVGYKVLNSTESYARIGNNTHRKLKVVVFHCTKAQFLEIEYLFSFYRELFDRELKIFMEAFVQKHEIFGKPLAVDSGEPDAEHLRKMFAMMNTMDDASPLKAIEQRGFGDSP